ncbi:uncharacterized protein LOC119689713 isoform X2 [Teleopsis dalmanni]|nr:uncharacterized protein LOC119689713 isoform X2 [Teleopsis dalmanni]
METDVELECSIANANKNLWCIKDLLFYPLGLVSHTVGNKSLFVTWSEDNLINFVFKLKTNALKEHHVYIPKKEIISNIFVLKLNTLLLMRSGKIYYFSSAKKTHKISWLKNVRCMTRSKNGFSIIRLMPDNALSLEVYADMPNIGKCTSTLLQRYDISFDERNLFNCRWQDDRFLILSQIVDEENVQFLNDILMLNDITLKPNMEFFFFTVSCSIFIVIPGDDIDVNTTPAYDIELFFTYASPVEFIKVLTNHKLLIVFLQCGTIDIWFISKAIDMKEHSSHYIGSVYNSYDMSDEKACFYYSDSEKVAQLQILYESVRDVYIIEETFKSIPGVVACTWIENTQELVCLNSNNIFYKVKFHENNTVGIYDTKSKFEKIEDLYELKPINKITQFLKKTEIVAELSHAPQKIRQEIEKQFSKQKLIAVCNKLPIYTKLLHASLEFHMQVPTTFPEDTVILFINKNYFLQSETLFALLHLRITENNIFKTAHWQLHIDITSSSHMVHIPNKLLNKKLCIILPLQRKMLQVLPNFNIQMLTFLKVESRCLAITLPINLKPHLTTYSNLFSKFQHCITFYNTHNISGFVANFQREELVPTKSNLIKHTLQCPQTCTFLNILRIFDCCIDEIKDSDTIELYVMSVKLILEYKADRNMLVLKSTDPVVLYYTKLYIISAIKKFVGSKDIINYTDIENTALELVMRLQCETESYLGLQDLEENVRLDPLNLFQINNLKKVYKSMRSELNYKLFR